MLRREMALVEQWAEIESALAPDWGDARLRLLLSRAEDAGRATALLAPLNPWRTGREVRFFAVRHGAGPRADAIERALRRLDREGIGGTVSLISADTAQAAPDVERARLADGWDAALATLPSDWSDLYVELELDSTDYIARAALDMAPLNPRRESGRPALAFRAASRFGYGASAGMVRRCLERCDRDGLTGDLHVLRALSDTFPVATQGPVWQIGGRTV